MTEVALRPLSYRRRWLLEQLPLMYAGDEVFSAFVALFEELAEQTTDQADMLPLLADIELTPPPMVPFIAGWLGVSYVDSSLPVARQRELVGRLGTLLGLRGTRRGLVELLEVLTEGEVSVEDSGGVYPSRQAPANPKLVTVHLSTAGDVPVDQLADLIRDEIPADCRLALRVDGVLVPQRSRRLRDAS